jgi:ceramide glucosyltransferase
VLITSTFCALALLSVGLLVWQFIAGLRVPLHQREKNVAFQPCVTVLKPLRGCDEFTRTCLRSWFIQHYRAPVQILFGVADASDPVCDLIRGLLKEFPICDAELVIAAECLGGNAKVSTLVQLARRAKHPVLCVSDADVRVPEDFLAQVIAPLHDNSVGLVNCFYRLANPSTPAMRWEAIAVNADFWSHVLQANTLKPQDFALGAAMVTRQENIQNIGGFESLLDYLADDYQLGQRIAQSGKRIVLSPVVVECWHEPMTWRDAWNHQLRWARTIRASQPVPYFFSILSNVTLWGTLFAGSVLVLLVATGQFRSLSLQFGMSAAACWFALVAFRIGAARVLSMRLTRTHLPFSNASIVILKDFFQIGIWVFSFLGHTVDWRGRRFRILRGGKLAALEPRN